MKTKTFKIERTIHADAEKVWDTMWNKSTYEKWAKEYTPGSHYEGTIAEGETIRFLDPKGNGMESKIEQLQENKLVQFRHIAEVENNEITKNYPDTMIEKYNYEEEDGKTTVTMVTEFPEEYFDEMKDKSEKAFDLVKTLSEQ